MRRTEIEGLSFINRRVSAAFLLINLANVYIGEAEDEAQKFGGFRHRLKHSIEKAKKGMEDFQSTLRHEADTQGKQMVFFEDFEKLERLVTAFINIDNDNYGDTTEDGQRQIGADNSTT